MQISGRFCARIAAASVAICYATLSTALAEEVSIDEAAELAERALDQTSRFTIHPSGCEPDEVMARTPLVQPSSVKPAGPQRRFPQYPATIEGVTEYRSRESWGARNLSPRTFESLIQKDGTGPDAIVIHEEQNDASKVGGVGGSQIRELEHLHVNGRKWKDIGYHFTIQRDEKGKWALFQGRTKVLGPDGKPTLALGDHALGQNFGKIGISIQGDYRRVADMSPFDPERTEKLAQISALERKKANSKDQRAIEQIDAEIRRVRDGDRLDPEIGRILEQAVGALANQYPSIRNVYTHRDLVTRSGKALDAHHTNCTCGQAVQQMVGKLQKEFSLNRTVLSNTGTITPRNREAAAIFATAEGKPVEGYKLNERQMAELLKYQMNPGLLEKDKVRFLSPEQVRLFRSGKMLSADEVKDAKIRTSQVYWEQLGRTGHRAGVSPNYQEEK